MANQWNTLGEKGAGTSSISGILERSHGGTEVDGTTIAANLVFSGPASGGAGNAAFRSLVISDLPSITESVQDIIGAFILGGANVTVTYNDPANTFTIAVTGIIPQANGGMGIDISALTGIISTAGGTITMLSSTGTGNVVRTSAPTITSPVVNTGVSGTAVDTDNTLTANSDTLLASQKAIKAHVTARINALAALLAGGNTLAGVNTFSGTGDFSGGTLILPLGTGIVSDDRLIWDTTRKLLLIGDDQQARGVSMYGWVPYAFPDGMNQANIFTTTSYILPAAGGSVMIPIRVTGHMLLGGVSFMNVDTTLARTVGWDLYETYLDGGLAAAGEKTGYRIAKSTVDQTFTAAAASLRTLACVDTYLPPGTYWLVVQCRHASNNFQIGFIVNGSFATTMTRNKTTTNPNGATIDLSTSWTANNVVVGARLNGKMFGEAAIF